MVTHQIMCGTQNAEGAALNSHGRKAIVIDEMKLSEEYNWEMPYQHGQPQATLEKLKDLGLEVVKVRRPVNVLVVEAEQ